MRLTDPRHLAFWAEAMRLRPDLDPGRLADAGPFDDTPEGAAFCATAVLEGRKTATSALAATARAYAPGDLEIVTLYDGSPVAVIEIMSSDLRRFDEIDAGFAEAEGDGSLEAWRVTHQRFYGARLAERGERLSGATLLCRIFFRRIHPV